MYKHIIIILSTMLLLVSCVDEQNTNILAPREDVGRLSVSVATDADNATRAPRELTDADKARFTISVTRDDAVVLPSKAISSLTADDLTLRVGLGYKVMAQSCTEAEAEVGFGQKRMAATSDYFAITKDQTTSIALCCLPQNAGVTVTVDDSFREVYGDNYRVDVVRDSRSLTFTPDFSDVVGYYNVPADGSEATLQLVANRLSDGNPVTATGKIALSRGQITRLCLKDDGIAVINLAITYDDTFTQQSINIIIDKNGDAHDAEDVLEADPTTTVDEQLANSR